MSHALVLAAVCVLWLAAPPALGASTDLQKFEKRVSRYAYSSGAADYVKPRRLCICTGDDVGNGTSKNQTGVLVYTTGTLNQETRVEVVCVVPVFDGEGALSGGAPCDTWTLLSR